MGDLAGCAWRALRLWVLAYFDDDTAMPGAVGFIQTSGELLNFHPHIHLLITDGVFCLDGTFERFSYFDTSLIERIFRAELLRVLLGKGLICQGIVDNLLSWRHSGFSVHGDVKAADRDAAARLGRYMIRCPLVLERLSLDEDTGEVLYRPRPSRAAHPEGPVAHWDVYELIVRVLDHLPPPRQQLVRYWGYYSNVSRGKRRAAAQCLALTAELDEESLSAAESPTALPTGRPDSSNGLVFCGTTSNGSPATCGARRLNCRAADYPCCRLFELDQLFRIDANDEVGDRFADTAETVCHPGRDDHHIAGSRHRGRHGAMRQSLGRAGARAVAVGRPAGSAL